MPVKRRVAKSREIDELKISELIEGPGTCLLAGCGYYLPHNGPGAVAGEAGGFFWELSQTGQKIVLERMRDGWSRHGKAVMAWWRGETEQFTAVCARRDPRDTQIIPWALSEFGETQ